MHYIFGIRDCHDRQRDDRILRILLRAEIGTFSPYFRAISLLNCTEDLEKEDQITGEISKNPGALLNSTRKLQQPRKLRLSSVPVRPTEVPKWQRPWNNDFSTWPSLRGKYYTHNDRQTTTIASQQPWNDNFCRIVQRPRNATTVKWQVRNCTIAAHFA